MPRPKDNLFFGLKLTEEQQIYADSIFDNQLTIIDAPAGTGKTMVAVAAAKLLGKQLNYIFAPVQEGSLGFLPGDLQDKTAPYLQPLLDALEEIGETSSAIFDPRLNPFMNTKAWINAMPHTFLRGTNFKNSITTVIDEAQNFTTAQLRKILTRVKDGKVIMIGNQKQCDLQNPADSGFRIYYSHFKNKDYSSYPSLTHNFRGQLAKDADSI